MGLILTYDLPKRYHKLVLYMMVQFGYSTSLPIDQNGSYHPTLIPLPTNTLFHPEKDPKAAITDLAEVCRALGCELTTGLATRLEAYTTVYNPQGFDRHKWLEQILPKDPSKEE